jgi:hypothetical protein
VNIHEILKLAGGVMALAMFVPMIVEIVRKRGAGQSFATWALWAVLDSMLTVTIWQQHGNYFLSLGFALGGIVLSAVLLKMGGFVWGKFESVIALMVLASLAVWKFSGPRNATIAVTTAICIAGVPGIVVRLRKPQRSAAKLWAGYTVANSLSLFGGAMWSVEERLAPAAFVALSVAMLAACWWPQKDLPKSHEVMEKLLA